MKHDLLAGFELRSLTDRFTQDVAFLPPIDLLDPVETAQPPFATVPCLAQRGDSRALVAGPVPRRPPPLLAEAPGLRRRAARRPRLRGPAERDRARRHALNPMLGLTFSPTTDLALHASWRHRLAPPSTQVVGAARARGRAGRPRSGAKLALAGGKAHRRPRRSTTSSATTSRSPTRPASRGRPATSARGASRSICPAEPCPGWVTYRRLRLHRRRAHELLGDRDHSLQPADFVVIDRSGNRPPSPRGTSSTSGP